MIKEWQKENLMKMTDIITVTMILNRNVFLNTLQRDRNENNTGGQ